MALEFTALAMSLKFHKQRPPRNFQLSHPKNTRCSRFLSLRRCTPSTFTAPCGPDSPWSTDHFLSVSLRGSGSSHSLFKPHFPGFCPWSSQLRPGIPCGWSHGVSTTHVQGTLESLFPPEAGVMQSTSFWRAESGHSQSTSSSMCSNSVHDSAPTPESLYLSGCVSTNSPDHSDQKPQLKQRSSASALLVFSVGSFFLVGHCPVYCRTFSNIPAFIPLDANCSLPVESTKNVPTHCHISLRGAVKLPQG